MWRHALQGARLRDSDGQVAVPEVQVLVHLGWGLGDLPSPSAVGGTPAP